MYIKHARTPHLPWSRGASDDDIFIQKQQVAHFAQMREVIVTEKMDGENTTFYPDYLHARAIVGIDHPSRDWVKALHANIKHDIPPNWRIVGENLYAKHSIYYSELASFFMVFAIFNDQNMCLSWNDTVACASMLNLATVPVLYSGQFNINEIQALDRKAIDSDIFEGYVVRNSDEFSYNDYVNNVSKFVRPNHIRTSDHWRAQAIIPNKLKD